MSKSKGISRREREGYFAAILTEPGHEETDLIDLRARHPVLSEEDVAQFDAQEEEKTDLDRAHWRNVSASFAMAKFRHDLDNILAIKNKKERLATLKSFVFEFHDDANGLKRRSSTMLMLLFNAFRNLDDPESMLELINSCDHPEFVARPLVREGLGVALNKTGLCQLAIGVAQGLLDDGMANGEVYGILGGAYLRLHNTARTFARTLHELNGDGSALQATRTGRIVTQEEMTAIQQRHAFLHAFDGYNGLSLANLLKPLAGDRTDSAADQLIEEDEIGGIDLKHASAMRKWLSSMKIDDARNTKAPGEAEPDMTFGEIKKNMASYMNTGHYALDHGPPSKEEEEAVGAIADYCLNMAKHYSQRGAEETLETYPLIRAALTSYYLHDRKQAQHLAKMAQAAVEREGGMETNNFWTAATLLEAGFFTGESEEKMVERLALLRQVGATEMQRNSIVSTFTNIAEAFDEWLDGEDGKRAMERIGPKLAQQREHLGQLIHSFNSLPIAEAQNARQMHGKDAVKDGTELFLLRTYNFRDLCASTVAAKSIQGSFVVGGQHVDKVFSRGDVEQMQNVLHANLSSLLTSENLNKLKDKCFSGGKVMPRTLSDIDNYNDFLEASSILLRQIYRTDELQMENMRGPGHVEYDRGTQSLNAFAGVNKNNVFTFDSRTNVSVMMALRRGDCRMGEDRQFMFDTWQEEKMNRHLRAALLHSPEGGAHIKEMRKFRAHERVEMRTMTVKVHVKSKLAEEENPRRPNFGIAVTDDKGRPEWHEDGRHVYLEDHTMNFMVYKDKDGKVTKIKFADAFYQNYYRWEKGEVRIEDLEIEPDTGRLKIPGKKLVMADGRESSVYIQATDFSMKRDVISPDEYGQFRLLGLPVECELDLVRELQEQRDIAEGINGRKSRYSGGIAPRGRLAALAAIQNEWWESQPAQEKATDERTELLTSYLVGGAGGGSLSDKDVLQMCTEIVFNPYSGAGIKLEMAAETLLVRIMHPQERDFWPAEKDLPAAKPIAALDRVNRGFNEKGDRAIMSVYHKIINERMKDIAERCVETAERFLGGEKMEGYGIDPAIQVIAILNRDCFSDSRMREFVAAAVAKLPESSNLQAFLNERGVSMRHIATGKIMAHR